MVEIPLAVPVIMAGVRTAVVLNIGVMAIAAYIGAGGLGTFISRGISQSDPRQLIVGAVAAALCAAGAAATQMPETLPPPRRRPRRSAARSTR